MEGDDHPDEKQGGEKPSVLGVVREVTIQAMKELDTGDYQPGSRPASGTRGSTPSRVGSATKRSPSALKDTSEDGKNPDEDPAEITEALAYRPSSRISSARPPSGRPPVRAATPQQTQSRTSPASRQSGRSPKPTEEHPKRAPSSPTPSPRMTRDEAEEEEDEEEQQQPRANEPPSPHDDDDDVMFDESPSPQRPNDNRGLPSDDEEGDEGLIVLDPDHPLMARFQQALKNQLTRRADKLALELRDLEEELKRRRKEREDVAVDLYGAQQELARHQMNLEKEHEALTDTVTTRQKCETDLSTIRTDYKRIRNDCDKEHQRESDLQHEVENLALRMFYMNNAKDTTKNDISVMKRAAEKADRTISKLEAEKQKQDVFVDRLTNRADRLAEDIALFEAQMKAKAEEKHAALDAVAEAKTEMETIEMEKRRLMAEWNSSIVAMRRRDEALSQLQQVLRDEQQSVLSIATEIEAYKKNIFQEQQLNEKYTLQTNQRESDMNALKRNIQNAISKYDIASQEMSTYQRTLRETDKELARQQQEKKKKEFEVDVRRKDIEKVSQEKVNIEDAIMEKLREHMTLEKGAEYTDKLRNKLLTITRDMDRDAARLEGDMAKCSLEGSNVQARNEFLASQSKQLEVELQEKDRLIQNIVIEIERRTKQIERKQTQVDNLNKKLEHMIANAGGVELGPLEIQINSLQKSIDQTIEKSLQLQQQWLRGQQELVRLAGDLEKESQSVDYMRKQNLILSQKKMRIEGNIHREKQEIVEIERSTKSMQHDLEKINQMLYREGYKKDDLYQLNSLMENDFIRELKEAERESLQAQQKLEAMKEEKERLLNSLVEAERQIMLWEKKIQIAKEMKQTVDSEVGRGEICAMKNEIHRMEVRYSQLMKEQEKLIREMENSVSRRETIVTRGEASQLLGKAHGVSKATFERQLTELKKKIRQTLQTVEEGDREIAELKREQQEMNEQIAEKEKTLQSLRVKVEKLEAEFEKSREKKQENFEDILTKQQRMKYYQQIKEGKYVVLCKTEAAQSTEREKQVNRVHALSSVVDRLSQDYPNVQPVMRKTALQLSTKISQM